MIMIFATIKQSYVILNLDADCSFYCPKLISKNKIFKDMSDQQHSSRTCLINSMALFLSGEQWLKMSWNSPAGEHKTTRVKKKSSNYAYILHHKTLCISLKKCLQHFIKEMFKKKF